MYSATTYSRRTLEQLTKDWLDAGANADGGTISIIDDALFYARLNGLLWDSTRNKGLVRLNLFAGDQLADALIPQISVLGNATETNTGVFVEDDFRNTGPEGGLTKSGTKYLDTGVTGAMLNQAQGGLGVLISGAGTYTIPSGTEAWMGVRDLGTEYNVLRSYNSGTATLSGFWGSNQQAIKAGGWTPIQSGDVMAMWGHSTGQVMKNKTAWSGVTPAAATHIYQVRVFCTATGNTPTDHLSAGTTLGAYFIWLGPNTQADREAMVDMLQAFNTAMGRTPPA